MPDLAVRRPADSQIEFIDLAAQRRRIGRRMDEAILRVVDHGKYIMGPEVADFEQELSAFCGAKHVLSCANGTDALGLALMVKNLKPGQAVLVPAFTFAATAEVVAWFDAVPVFVDVREDTFIWTRRASKPASRPPGDLGWNRSALSRSTFSVCRLTAMKSWR